MILNAIQVILFLLIAIQVLLGGFSITLNHKVIAVNQVDIPGIFFFISIIWCVHKNKTTIVLSFSNKLWEKLKDLGNQKYVLLSISILSILLFTLIHSFKHLTFHTHGYDMAFVNQAIFKMFSPKLLSCDVCLNNTYLGEHISWALLLLAPVSFFKSNYVLFFTQSTLIIFPLYLILNSKNFPINKSYSIILFFLILSSRSLRNSLYWDLREDDLIFFFLSLMLLSYLVKNLYLYFLFLIGALICKENVSLVTIGFGAYSLFDKRLTRKERRQYFWLTIITSMTYLLITFGYFIPKFTDGKQSEQVILIRFGKYGHTPKEVLINMITTPSIWFDLIKNNIFTFDRLKYLVILLIPFFAFILKDLLVLIPISTGLVMNMLPASSAQRMMIYHYDLIILPFGIYAILKTIKNFEEKKLKYILLLSLSVSGTWPIYHFRNNFPLFNDLANNQFLNNETKGKVVASNLSLLSHFVHIYSIRSTGEKSIDSLEDFAKPEIRGNKSIIDSELIVLDSNNKEDMKSLNFLTKNQFSILKKSRDNRFIILVNRLNNSRL